MFHYTFELKHFGTQIMHTLTLFYRQYQAWCWQNAVTVNV